MKKIISALLFCFSIAVYADSYDNDLKECKSKTESKEIIDCLTSVKQDMASDMKDHNDLATDYAKDEKSAKDKKEKEEKIVFDIKTKIENIEIQLKSNTGNTQAVVNTFNEESGKIIDNQPKETVSTPESVFLLDAVDGYEDLALSLYRQEQLNLYNEKIEEEAGIAFIKCKRKNPKKSCTQNKLKKIKKYEDELMLVVPKFNLIPAKNCGLAAEQLLNNFGNKEIDSSSFEINYTNCINDYKKGK